MNLWSRVRHRGRRDEVAANAPTGRLPLVRVIPDEAEPVPAESVADIAAAPESESEPDGGEKSAGVSSDEGTGPVLAASNTVVEPVGVSAAPVGHEQALADRQALIQLCLYAMDRARSSGVVERLEQGLTGIGVHAVRPEGQRFDPAVHEAGGAVPTEDVSLQGTVAETEVVGFIDHERLLRAPVVTVYTRR